MVITCVIQFNNNPEGTVFAGEVLSGQVVLTTDTPELVKALILKIKGDALTSWEETRSDDRKESFDGHQNLIDAKYYLFGTSESKAVFLEPGSSTYKFAYEIPNCCPSSFKGIHGSVLYRVHAKLIRHQKCDQVFKRYFTVLKVLDLNVDRDLWSPPAQAEVHKTYWSLFRSSKPLTLRMSLPQRGFVPGQTIPVWVWANNESNIPVEEIKASLIMMVNYYDNSQFNNTTAQRIVVNKKKAEGVMPKCTKQWNFDLYVPATPSSCYNLCRIIKIDYRVNVEAKVKGLHLNGQVHIPVTIGTVPLIPQQTPEYDLPPPSYEEAMHLSAYPEVASKMSLGTELEEEIAFTPVYAVFNSSKPLVTTDESKLTQK